MTSSRHLVDPELHALLDSFPEFELSDAILPLMRAAPPFTLDADQDGFAVVSSQRVIPGPDGAPNVEVLLHVPAETGALRGALLHIHGGGYIAGSAEMGVPAHRLLANSLGAVVVSVQYRLAPETRFPGAIEDCYAALAWLTRSCAEFAIDPARIGVMGESAGGGLAASLALMARDRGEYALAFQHLIYPMIDDRTCLDPDPHPFAGEFIWTPHSNVFGWGALLGVAPGSPDVSPYAAAARAADLSRLPPTYLAVGALDLFLEENFEYARRLTRHGVCVELHVYPGAFHAFNISPDAQISLQAQRDSLKALSRALGQENGSGGSEPL